MGFFDDFAAADAASLTDAFGESVLYTPRVGTARTIQAVVSRFPREFLDVGGNVYRPRITVLVANSATLGIASNDANMIGGSITVPIRRGETAVKLTIGNPNPLKQDDAGAILLGLGA